ncbi:MAG: DmsC/YnfH family molybdoenzyme membrane anchor subunit [Gordonibacter pamelaeae]
MDIQWSLVLFTALTGLGGWLFFFVGLNILVGKTDKGAFAGTMASLALTVVGGCASVTHLSHPDRMLGALQHPTSGIFTEAALVGLLCIVLVAFFVMLKRSLTGTPLKAVAVIGMALGALMSFMAGQSYLMPAIAAWNTELLPLGYLGTAAASGAAAWLLLTVVQKADEAAVSFAGLMTFAGGCAALVTGTWRTVRRPVRSLGDAALLVGVAALCGGAVPAACAAPWRGRGRATGRPGVCRPLPPHLQVHCAPAAPCGRQVPGCTTSSG